LKREDVREMGGPSLVVKKKVVCGLKVDTRVLDDPVAKERRKRRGGDDGEKVESIEFVVGTWKRPCRKRKSNDPYGPSGGKKVFPRVSVSVSGGRGRADWDCTRGIKTVEARKINKQRVRPNLVHLGVLRRDWTTLPAVGLTWSRTQERDMVVDVLGEI